MKILKKLKYIPYYIFPYWYQVKYWLKAVANGRNGRVIQIGSNDGKTDDPLYQLVLSNKDWNMTFVEPVKYVFENLKKNFPKEERFTFINNAVNNGTQEKFYYLDESVIEQFPNLPGHYDKLGSFNKKNITKHLGKEVEPYIKIEEINGLSLSSLLESQLRSGEDFLILHTDTEGYDWKILSQLHLDKFNPKLLIFEHKHLSKTEKEEMYHFFSSHYRLYQFGQDILGIQIDVFEMLTNRQRRLLAHERLAVTL